MSSSVVTPARWQSAVLGGCRADLLSQEDAVELVLDRSRAGTPHRPLGVVSVNLDHLNHFAPGSRWADVFEAPDLDWLHLLDGAPLVQQARRLTGEQWPRLAGSDLVGPLLDAAQDRGCRVGFLGGGPETQAALAATLPEVFPRLDVRGWWAPERSQLADPTASRLLAAEVRAAGVDMLVVGLGKPRQELWIAEYGALTGARTLLAFGAVVDFLAGRVRRAPEWVSGHGLEWAWRLSLEPRRLARRYLVQGPPAYVNLRRHSNLADPRSEVPSVPAGSGVSIPAQRSPLQGLRADRFVGPDEHADAAVLVVTYNNAADVGRLVASLRRETRENRLRVVVADNASSDGTLAAARVHDDVIAFSTGGNLGYAAGINLAGLRAGDADALLVLNPDLVVEEGAIAAMRRRLARPHVGAVVPRLADADGATYPSLRREPSVTRALGDALLGSRLPGRPGWLAEMDHDPESYLHPHTVDWATGAAVLVSRAAAQTVGEWDEDFFLYSEETDYFRRLRSAGFSVWYEPEARMQHRQGGSGTSTALTALMSVNRVRYIVKHGTPAQARAVRAAVALGEALRVNKPGHLEALRFVLDRERWRGLPRAERPGPDADPADFPTGSVVIPAHNEAAVIGRTLRPLAPLARKGRLEVVVACNGCTDDTAAVARRFRGVIVLEIPEPSKVAALNAADAVARWWPRVYLDADVEMPATALRPLLERLHRGDVLAARPPFSYDVRGADRIVRGYYRARSRIPGTSRSLWGAGVYAVTREGRARFASFPEVTADDLYVDSVFSPVEKVVVDGPPVHVRTPRDLPGLMAVLRRTYRGNRELARSAGDTGQTPPSTNLASLLRSVRGPRRAVDAGIYVGAVLTARAWTALSRGSGWERDDSSRG